MSNTQTEEKNKVEPFFCKLKKLASEVESGIKEIQNKTVLPKSDLPENSALITSVQLLDNVLALKKEMNNIEEQLDDVENSRQDFIDSFDKNVKDTERKIEELENILKKYGYIPWEPPQPDAEKNVDQDKSNLENETTVDEVVSQTADVLSVPNGDQERPNNKMSNTPEYSSRSLTYILRNSTNKPRNGTSKHNADDVTPQLKLRSSCRRLPVSQSRTPVCFSNDVVCTPGLFIPFQQKCLRNGTLMNPSLFGPAFVTGNGHMEERENMYTNLQSPRFYEEDITMELFKKVRLPSSCHQAGKESVTPEEPNLHTQHIIEEIQKSTMKKISRREESVTPEEPILHAQNLMEEIRRSTRKHVNRREESITPEEPVLHTQHLMEEIRKSTKKSITFQTTRIPIKDGNVTPESPKLKSLLYLKKSKTYQNLFH